MLLGAGATAALALAAALAVTLSCGTRRDVSPYAISFYMKKPDGSTLTPGDPLRRDGPLLAHFYSNKFDERAFPLEPPLNMVQLVGRHLHPFVFRVTDPDGLLYLWWREFSERERREWIEQWRAAPRGSHFECDLQEWIPEGFPWQSGLYRLGCSPYVSSLIRTSAPFSGYLVIDKPFDPEEEKTGRKPLLEAVLEANGETFRPGEPIVLRGRLRNVSRRPFLVQTHYPFREARLVAQPCWDTFPSTAKSFSALPIRLSHFTRLDPGEEVHLFEEHFVAGRPDAHWGMGARSESFPPPFAGPDRTIVLTFESGGLFPQDRLPDLGIWTGKVESDPIQIRIVKDEEGGPGD